jgi:transposase
MDAATYSTYEVRVRAVRAVREGMRVGRVASAYHVHRITLYRWLTRHRAARGNRGLRRRAGSGRPRKLEDFSERALRAVVLKPASTFGFETDFWTAKRLRQILKHPFGIVVSNRTILRRLHDAGLTYQKPEREYLEIDHRVRRKWLKEVLPRIRETIDKYRAILYCEDESNIMLTALLGKTWARRGKTPKQKVSGKRGSVSAMSALNHAGRLVFTLHDKRIASIEVIRFLDQLLQHHKGRHIVVVMDQAPPHVSKLTARYIDSQRRLHVFHLPPYSPDWNPDEKVWNYLKHEELKSHQARTTKQLKQLARRKLNHMRSNPTLLKGLFFRCCVADLLA